MPARIRVHYSEVPICQQLLGRGGAVNAFRAGFDSCCWYVKDRDTYNAYLNDYMKDRWKKRRAKAVEYLGGVCVKCGSSEELEFDHIDPETKSFTIAAGSSFSEERFWPEVDKCQLLCKDHHIEKSSRESSVGHGEGLTGKKNCFCDLCRPKKNEYVRNWKRKKRSGSVQ